MVHGWTGEQTEKDSLMLTVIFFGSNIIIFMFILVFSTFAKNPYYCYDQ